MKRKKNNNIDLKDFKKLLENCSFSDFDGHTEFNNISPAQRLDWLAQLEYFIYECKHKVFKKR